MTHRLALQYVEIDIPSFDQPDSPPNSPLDSPPQAMTTYRFVKDAAYLPSDIEAIPSIVSVDVSPSIISLGEDLGKRATVTVNFRDHKHIFLTESFDSGTFWGKFRARYGLKLQGRELRLIQGFVGQALVDMETRTYIIESTDGPSTDGRFKIIAKDLFKLADGERAQAPLLSTGFLSADITNSALTLTLSPSGIGDSEYPLSGYAAIGGSEIVSFARAWREPANDSFVKILLKFNGTDTSTTITDSNAGGSAHTWTAAGNAQIDTAFFQYAPSSGLFDGSGDWVTTTDHADFTLGTSAFAVDMWVKRAGTGTRWIAGQCNSSSLLSTVSFIIGFNASNQLTATVTPGGANVTLTGTTALTDTASFHHVALTRSGSNFFIFLDGAQEATASNAGSINDSSNDFRVGAAGELTTTPWNGSIQHFRLSVGASRHASAFTPADDYTLVTTTGDVMTIVRAQYNTVAAAHTAQDRVQLCLEYLSQDVADIIYDLMTNYADVDPTLIELTTWQAETAEFLNVVYSALIAEPKAVNKLISELIEQAGLVVWWDELSATFRLQVLRAISTAAETYDAEVIIADTLKVTEQPQKRLSQVYVYFAKINPILNDDQLENYRSTAFSQDLEAEAEYGAIAVKKIFSRWIPTGGRSVAETVSDILLSRFRDPPRRVNFELFRDESGNVPMLGGGYQIEAWCFQEQDGTAALVPVQLTSVNALPDRFEVEAEEMLFTVTATSPDNHVIVIDSNLNNVDLRDMHDSIYSTPVSGDTVTCTITAGVIVGSTSRTAAAFVVGTWPAGVTVNVIVIGRIQGCGGNGGNGGSASFQVANSGAAGQSGGTALYTRQAINLTAVDGEIWGGGGGGGGGGAFSDFSEFAVGGDGGGGGAGSNPGTGGSGAFGTTGSGKAAGAGTTELGGEGDISGGGANGGDGGGPGLAGGHGDNVTANGGNGGAAGSAVDGISFVTFMGGSSPSGDIRGGQVN